MEPKKADEPITRISVFLRNQQLEGLRSVNERTGIPVSVLIRQGVDRVLAEHGGVRSARLKRITMEGPENTDWLKTMRKSRRGKR